MDAASSESVLSTPSDQDEVTGSERLSLTTRTDPSQ